MRIAHVCADCGNDITRENVWVEPVYRLPIVTCPSCSAVVVRRTHPVWAGWRVARHVVRSVLGLLVRVAGCLAFGGAVLGFSVVLEHAIFSADRRGENPLTNETVLVAALMCLAVSSAAGLWLGAAFSHWRWWLLVPVWLVGVSVLFLAPMFAEMIDEVIRVAETQAPGFTKIVGRWTWNGRWVLAVVACSVLPTAAMIPVGRLAQSSGERMRRKWMWKRRRAIRRRRGQ